MEKILDILLIEDDKIEVMKFHRTLKKLFLKHNVVEANDGEEALKVLEDRAHLPDIILLDLNMPKISGKEFLRILKNDDELKYLPTIILSTSSNHKDLLECFEIGIAGYIIKPLKYEDYIAKIERVLAYWSINELIKA